MVTAGPAEPTQRAAREGPDGSLREQRAVNRPHSRAGVASRSKVWAKSRQRGNTKMFRVQELPTDRCGESKCLELMSIINKDYITQKRGLSTGHTVDNEG